MRRGLCFTSDEGGFTVPASAIALLLVFALVFTCLHAYTVGSRSGQIQYVADAAALAADHVVADFVTAGQVLDALLLSFSLAGITVYAVSAVVAFIPGGATAAEEIAQVGGKILKARDKFADSATDGLDKVQKALPVLCAVRAAQCVQANAQASGVPYAGIALACPLEAPSADLADDEAVEEMASDIEDEEGEISKQSEKQNLAQKRADAAKERAWRADCGATGMCMLERAGHLAGLSGTSNPYISQVERWSFSLPLARAKAYYRARYYAEPGTAYQGSAELVAESVARKRFYAYALSEVSKGFVSASATGGEDPHLAALARNTEQIKQTFLYTEQIYPLSSSDGKLTLHSHAGCPGYQQGAAAGLGSAQMVDAGSAMRCEHCKFSASTLGRVPLASTAINNGFEYYYRIVVEEAGKYAEATRQMESAQKALEGSRKKVCESLSDALKSLGGKRYDPQPPGRYGCVAVVIAPQQRSASLPFVDGVSGMPPRMAVSAAALAPDEASDGHSVVSDLAVGLLPQPGFGQGILKGVFGAWSALLVAYTEGHDGISSAFRTMLGAIPLVGTELSDWAASGFEKTMKDAGLEPANLDTYKPVVVNTSQVLARSSGKVAYAVRILKQSADVVGAAQVACINDVLSTLEDCPDLSDILEERGLVVATIPLSKLGNGLEDVKLILPAPNNLIQAYSQAVSQMSSAAGG